MFSGSTVLATSCQSPREEESPTISRGDRQASTGGRVRIALVTRRGRDSRQAQNGSVGNPILVFRHKRDLGAGGGEVGMHAAPTR